MTREIISIKLEVKKLVIEKVVQKILFICTEEKDFCSNVESKIHSDNTLKKQYFLQAKIYDLLLRMEDVIEMGNTEIIPNNELEQRYIRYKAVLKELTIMNDIFMRNAFKKRECVEYILRIIMEMKDLQVLEHTVQMDYKNLQGRSAVLDCVARDAKNKRYNVEIQQETEGASYKRARYHSGLLDMNTLNPGQNHEELPDSYVIFITRDDVPGRGLPIYHVNRVIRETGETFGDGSHIIYVNSRVQDKGTALGRLMHDLNCKDAAEMYSKVLAQRVFELKETEEGSNIMCEALEKIVKEGELRGETKGEMKERKKNARALSRKGMSVEEIAEILSEKEETVRSWLVV